MAEDTRIAAQDRPDAKSRWYEEQEKAVRVVRDVYGGTLRMRERGETYLPQFPREKPTAYTSRLGTAVLYNATRRTVRGLTGMVFRKDPQVSEDVPETMRDHLENVDLTGRALDVFGKDVFEAALLDGHSYIFVDHQEVDPGAVRTLGDQRRAGLRPYWCHVTKQQLIGARWADRGGRPVLTQIVWKEQATEPHGKFGEKQLERYRVYRLEGQQVAWEVWERKEDQAKEKLQLVRDGTMSLPFIPLVPVYADRTGFMRSEPPMLDLALENVKHWQVRSDHDHIFHLAAAPVPVFSGLAPDSGLAWGPQNAVLLPEGGDAKYLEPRGTALSEGREHLRDIEQRMAALGLAMLQRDTRAAETAESRRIEKSETDSALSTAARGLEDGLNLALEYHATWLKTEVGGSVSVNRDFESQLLDAQMVATLSALVGQQAISLETLWEILEQGEVLPDGFDAGVEMDRISGAGLPLLGPSLGRTPPPGDGQKEAPGEAGSGAEKEVA